MWKPLTAAFAENLSPSSQKQPPLSLCTLLSLSRNQPVFLFEQTLRNPNPSLFTWRHSGSSSSNSGTATSGKSLALQVRRASIIFGDSPAFGPVLPGTGFETLPPLAISSNLFQFLKSLGLDSVGLGLNCVFFHSGWELVVWEPRVSMVEVHVSEIVEICEEVEVEDSIEVFGLKLN